MFPPYEKSPIMNALVSDHLTKEERSLCLFHVLIRGVAAREDVTHRSCDGMLTTADKAVTRSEIHKSCGSGNRKRQ